MGKRTKAQLKKLGEELGEYVINDRADYDRWLRENYMGWADDMAADNPDDDSDFASDCVGDMARDLIRFPDPEAQAAIAYLRREGVIDIVGCLADDLYHVAHDQKGIDER